MSNKIVTLGQAALEAQKNAQSYHAVDIINESEKEFSEMMQKIIREHRDYGDKYYIQILNIQENMHRKWLSNVYKRKFIVRKSRPRPDHDTTLYSYDNTTDTLEFHWTVPDAYTTDYLIENQNELPESEKELLKYAKMFCDGTLV